MSFYSKGKEIDPFNELSKILDNIPELKILQDLVRLEEQIDSILISRSIDISNKPQNSSLNSYNLRIFLEHQLDEKTSEDQSSWTFFVRSYIANASGETIPGITYKLSNLFSKIIVLIEPLDDLSGKETLEWEKNDPSNTDGFEINRLCKSSDTLITILFYRAFHPPLFRLSEKLVTLLKTNAVFDTRANVISLLLNYIYQNNLVVKPGSYRCDKVLNELFGVDSISLHEMTNLISSYLSIPDPVSIVYRISCSDSSSQACYSIPIIIPLPSSSFLLPFNHSDFDYNIDQKFELMKNSFRRYEYFRNFSKTPVEMLQSLIDNQEKDANLFFELNNMKNSIYSQNDIIQYLQKIQ